MPSDDTETPTTAVLTHEGCEDFTAPIPPGSTAEDVAAAWPGWELKAATTEVALGAQHVADELAAAQPPGNAARDVWATFARSHGFTDAQLAPEGRDPLTRDEIRDLVHDRIEHPTDAGDGAKEN